MSGGKGPPLTPLTPRRQARRRALGAALQHTLAAHGLTQDAAGGRGGHDRQMLSHIITGANSPRLDNLWDIADGLGVPLSTLILAAEKRLTDGRGTGD